MNSCRVLDLMRKKRVPTGPKTRLSGANWSGQELSGFELILAGGCQSTDFSRACHWTMENPTKVGTLTPRNPATTLFCSGSDSRHAQEELTKPTERATADRNCACCNRNSAARSAGWDHSS